MSTDAYLEQLGREHGFTLAELEANRQGALHPAQLARGTRKGLAAVVVSTVLGFLALGSGLVGAYVFYDGLGPDPSSVDLNAVYATGGAGVVLALIFFVGAGTSFVRRRARKAAFMRGRIDVLEGPMDKIHIRGRRLRKPVHFPRRRSLVSHVGETVGAAHAGRTLQALLRG